MEDRTTPATFTVNTTLDELVPGDGKLSLREAIARANANPGADVIVLPAGTFKITIPGAGEDGNLAGDFNITDSVTVQGAGAGLTIIDGQQLDRVFDARGIGTRTIKVVLQGLAVRNGSATGDGGGIQLANTDLVARDCAITGNQASHYGGGISNFDAAGTGTLKLVRSTVSRNVAAFGGGVFGAGEGVVTAAGSTFRNNVADGGGGILAHTAVLTNCTITGNTAREFGGGGISATTKAVLTNCLVSVNSARQDGGGLYVHSGTATLTGSTFTGNTAASGGGVYFWGYPNLKLNLSNSTVKGNVSTYEGGGVWVGPGTATLTNSTVTGNRVELEASGHGGGIFVYSTSTTLTLTGSTISENIAAIGGGVFSNSAVTGTGSRVKTNFAREWGGGLVADTVTLKRSTVSNNVAYNGFGGGLNAGTVTLTHCTVSGNTARNGGNGGIGATTATLTHCTVSGNTAANGPGGGLLVTTATLTNCTVSGNSASDSGGGIWAAGGALLNCTIAKNSAPSGGGVFHYGAFREFTVKNTIIALNLFGTGGSDPDVSGTFTSEGHNLIGDVGLGLGFTNGVTGDIVGTSLNPIDPKIGPLQNNGGPTKTHALLFGSKAIDRGDNSGVLATDQRGFGFARIKDGKGTGRAIVDIGAFEK